MTISAFDLIILGMLTSLGGALLIVKGNRRRSIPARLVQHTALERNPFDIRQESIRHAHAAAGARWLTVGAVALLLGMTRGTEAIYLIEPWIDAGLHLVVISASWVATAARAKRQSRQRYLPTMIALHRHGFEQSLELLTHQGYTSLEVERNIQVPEATRRQRLSEVSSCLDCIGRLVDLARRRGEGDHAYAERLRPLFRATSRS